MSGARRRGWGAGKGDHRRRCRTRRNGTSRKRKPHAPAGQSDAGDADRTTEDQATPTRRAPSAPPDDDIAEETAEAAEPDEDEADGGDEALKDQLLRALADAENARRRARKDVEDARAYAISRFAQDLLGVGDNLGRALDSIPAERRESDDAVKAIAEGIEMTAREFETALGRHGITKIDPLGEKFDYNLHQALFETDQTDQPDGTVVQVLQTGYRIGERLLREAMVGVAKGGAVPADGADADTEAEAESEEEDADTPADNAS